MSRPLTPKSSLDNLKKEAKRWLKALRSNLGEARARLERALPNASPQPTLRDVQHALALELGFSGWAALKERLARATPADDLRDDLIIRFLDNACPDHHVRGGPDHVRARHTAMRLLMRYPEIAHANFSTAVVCGDLARVDRMIAEHPELANAKDSVPGAERSDVGGSGDLYHRDLGPKGWEPLLYLCFTRLPLPGDGDSAVAIARALLDRGADPNCYFMAGSSRYTPLVGAIGEGEEARPPHPEREALVRLLLERGANPYDIQVLYNIHFKGDILWFFKLIYEQALKSGRKADWDDPDWPMLDMGGYGTGAYFTLAIAVGKNDLELAEWLLTHGANPRVGRSSHPKFQGGNLNDEAMRRGYTEMADLLVRYGATPTDVELSDMEQYAAACLRMDWVVVQAHLTQHPGYLEAPQPLFEATRRDRADIVKFLLDLGVSPNVENKQKERALHIAAYENSLNVARLLIARGAEIDPVESNWSNTPLGGAVYGQHAAMIDLLGRYSRDVWELTYAGKLERLREVLAEQPELARVAGGGHTPLMWLPPEDEAHAIQVARLLLSHGADPAPRNTEGMTAADRAERLGMFDLAEMLRAAATPT
jgi:ankyrin repeat protein